ncbi:hypothetical protein H072_11054 [Dactylellina haptotyla CBS 200.50]|uniref:F-box domain-containing protein n=1 Tax=Dactylellina haptotyla (strain CBS 200.50) TaxID=1284197 RepID=S7ZXQ8_DACHA|nr:hypothetical protein H072_11054 [Dactylellina haptotyla CBS 200.50]
MANLSTLPAEVLLEILSHLDAFTCIFVLRGVSRRIREVSKTACPTMHGLPPHLWYRVISYLKLPYSNTNVPTMRKLSRSFHNFMATLIARNKLPESFYSHQPVRLTEQRRLSFGCHPFLKGMQFKDGEWIRLGGRRSIQDAGSMLFEACSMVPVDTVRLGFWYGTFSASPEALREHRLRRIKPIVYAKREKPNIVTNLDVLVAADEFLHHWVEVLCVRVRDGKLYITQEMPGLDEVDVDLDEVDKVSVGSARRELEYIDDVLHSDKFLRGAAKSKLPQKIVEAKLDIDHTLNVTNASLPRAKWAYNYKVSLQVIVWCDLFSKN